MSVAGPVSVPGVGSHACPSAPQHARSLAAPAQWQTGSRQPGHAERQQPQARAKRAWQVAYQGRRLLAACARRPRLALVAASRGGHSGRLPAAPARRLVQGGRAARLPRPAASRARRARSASAPATWRSVGQGGRQGRVWGDPWTQAAWPRRDGEQATAARAPAWPRCSATLQRCASMSAPSCAPRRWRRAQPSYGAHWMTFLDLGPDCAMACCGQLLHACFTGLFQSDIPTWGTSESQTVPRACPCCGDLTDEAACAVSDQPRLQVALDAEEPLVRGGGRVARHTGGCWIRL